MSNDLRELIYGLKPMRRENPKQGESEWYYSDPRGATTVSAMKSIDVPSENSPNPVDYKNKVKSPKQLEAYGGKSGILWDGLKDFGNNLIGSSLGFTTGDPQKCDIFLPQKLKNKKY